MPQIELSAGTIDYTDTGGGGPVIVLLHGLLGSLADYARQAGPTTGTVQQLLGRPALGFAQWAAENAAAFGPLTGRPAAGPPRPSAGPSCRSSRPW
jgi:pimeloyl-ACP methyl ester carboxylesterase